MRAQLLLQARTARPGRDPGAQRLGVDLEHLVKTAKVDGHHAVKAPGIDRGLDAAHHARPAAEGDHRGVGRQRPFQDRLDLGLVGGVRHDVGRMVELPAEGADDIAVGAAVGVEGARMIVVGADPGQAGGGAEARLGELDL